MVASWFMNMNDKQRKTHWCIFRFRISEISTWQVTDSGWPGVITTLDSCCPWGAWLSIGWRTSGGSGGSATTLTRSSPRCWTSRLWTASQRRSETQQDSLSVIPGWIKLISWFTFRMMLVHRPKISILSLDCDGRYLSLTLVTERARSASCSRPSQRGRLWTRPATSTWRSAPPSPRSGSWTRRLSGTSLRPTSPPTFGWCWSTWDYRCGRWGSPAWGCRRFVAEKIKNRKK